MHLSSKALKGRNALWSAGGLAVFCILALGCIGGGPESNSCREPELRISAARLAEIFRKNESSAYERWRGRNVAVEGVVALAESRDEEPYAELSAYGGYGIRCIMDKEDADDAAKLARGQHAVFAGKVAGLDVDHAVLIRPCRIMDADAAARLPEQARVPASLPAPEPYGDAAELLQDCKAAGGAMAGRYVSVSGPVVKAEEINGVCHAVLDGGVHCTMRDKIECEPGSDVMIAGTVESCNADAAELRDCTLVGAILNSSSEQPSKLESSAGQQKEKQDGEKQASNNR